MACLHLVPHDAVRAHGRDVALPDSLLLPGRPQVQVILQQLPLHLPAPLGEQVFQLARGQPGRCGPSSSATSAVNASAEAAKGPASGIWAYGSIGLFFRSGSSWLALRT